MSEQPKLAKIVANPIWTRFCEGVAPLYVFEKFVIIFEQSLRKRDKLEEWVAWYKGGKRGHPSCDFVHEFREYFESVYHQPSLESQRGVADRVRKDLKDDINVLSGGLQRKIPRLNRMLQQEREVMAKGTPFKSQTKERIDKIQDTLQRIEACLARV